MNAHKNDLRELSTRQLLARRRAAAGRLGDVEQVLAGTLTEQARRCGRPGQHLLHVAEPARRRAAPGKQLRRGQAAEIVLVCIHHTRECRYQAPESTTPQ